ncbi:MAG: hypothetical protein OJF47_003029 [Nitrospira sp.]|nr:MAG: hypothetical protein OJF47_003029 [Nitrospira sp.]
MKRGNAGERLQSLQKGVASGAKYLVLTALRTGQRLGHT